MWLGACCAMCLDMLVSEGLMFPFVSLVNQCRALFASTNTRGPGNKPLWRLRLRSCCQHACVGYALPCWLAVCSLRCQLSSSDQCDNAAGL